MDSRWYESSTGTGLSATVAGFSVMGIAQAVSFGLQRIGHPIEQNDIYNLIVSAIAAIGGVVTCFGLVRKAYLKVRG